MTDQTKDQIASVMLQHGTPEQKKEALLYCSNALQYKPKTEKFEALIADLKWYGACIAGAGPITGYYLAAKKADQHWYAVTLPLLNLLEKEK